MLVDTHTCVSVILSSVYKLIMVNCYVLGDSYSRNNSSCDISALCLLYTGLKKAFSFDTMVMYCLSRQYTSCGEEFLLYF